MKPRPNLLSQVFAPLAVAVILTLMVSCDLRDKTVDAKQAPTVETGSNTEADAKIIISLVEMNQEEVALSRLAIQRSTHKDVLALAGMLEDAHSSALVELTELARDRDLPLPIVLNNASLEVRTELSALKGKEFDMTYCNKMVEGHKRSMVVVEAASKDANGADLRDWATGTLPRLREHLMEALACQKKCETILSNS